jgi:hypothetical protein
LVSKLSPYRLVKRESKKMVDNEGCAIFFYCRSWFSSHGAQQAIRVSNAASVGFGSAPLNSFASGSLIRVDLDPVSITGAIVPIDPSTVTIKIRWFQREPAKTTQIRGQILGRAR